MKKAKRWFLIIGAILLAIVISHLIYLYSLTPDETYPEDSYFTYRDPGTALIVVAHDDDASMFSGTTSLLVEKGWKVHWMCFYNSYNHVEDIPIRKEEMKKVAEFQGISSLRMIDFNMRNRLDTVRFPYIAIPYSEFATNFKMDSLKLFIQTAIQELSPTVIFSLDDQIGGYGHPEHVVVSKMILEVCQKWNESQPLSVQRIYQNVWPPSQSQRIMGDQGVFGASKKIYGVPGMPEPDVEIDISDQGVSKMRVLTTFKSQKRNLKKFAPFFYLYPGEVYFRVFDKEHFRVIEME